MDGNPSFLNASHFQAFEFFCSRFLELSTTFLKRSVILLHYQTWLGKV